MFYSTAHPNLTTDHKVHNPRALETSYNEWKNNKTGFMSTFPFGVFAYARMDERLAKEPLWQKYLKEAPAGSDPMGLHPTKQPSIELFNTECYGGPKQYDDFPNAPDQSAFSIIVELFSPRSRGSVTLASRDPVANPVVDPAFLAHELDLLVLSEGCRFADEVITKGAGTTDVVTGSWPKGLGYGESGQMRTRKEWEPYVKDHATTCKSFLSLLHREREREMLRNRLPRCRNLRNGQRQQRQRRVGQQAARARHSQPADCGLQCHAYAA